ncbi:hypothetical protein F2Q69_00063807 [Brassica cretica]|uniref:Uncharacterized protein n=1 Tax=Brassica cretica TaxID=69181 RepID=A0A8S9RNN3_BRACR|nr:hypothetical protein F2Q69_00063807 [Brassica cretica]
MPTSSITRFSVLDGKRERKGRNNHLEPTARLDPDCELDSDDEHDHDAEIEIL